MAISATITKVSLANTANGPRIVITMNTGDTQWYPKSYIDKLLIANFMEGARPTTLVGTEVSYKKVTYKEGDFSVDNAGKPTTIKHTKDGSKLINFEFGDIAGKVSEYDKAVISANAVANAMVLKGAFSAPKPVAVAQEEVVADGEETI